tara:strand:+ start:92 stop:823 length:732 start_codon:yes stop_codon:yes gene_type:complete
MLGKIRLKLVEIIIAINEKLIFERRLKRFFIQSENAKIETVIDVGANRGQTINFFFNLNKNVQIHSFEPNHKLFKFLLKRYQRNSKINIYNLGVSDKNGKKIFHENFLDLSSSFEELNHSSTYLARKAQILGVKPDEIINRSYNVETTTLNDFIRKKNISNIDLLKIDTEGHEHACLEGLFSKNINIPIKYIQLENHNDDMYANRIPFKRTISLLNKNSFFECIRIKHGFGKVEEVIFKYCNK